MPKHVACILGAGGIPPGDDPRADWWHRRVYWAVVGFALLAVPALYLEVLGAEPALRRHRDWLGWSILIAFAAELAALLFLVRQKWRYLRDNWLSFMIILTAAATLWSWHADGSAGSRTLVVALSFLLLARVAVALLTMSPAWIAYFLLAATVTAGVAGIGFYWLEPTVHSYFQGLWLAFTSGATVGYGDLVPTTPASRLFAVAVVLVGYALLSLMSAALVAYFMGKEEEKIRREMHHDVKQLRDEFGGLRNEILRLHEKLGAPDRAQPAATWSAEANPKKGQ